MTLFLLFSHRLTEEQQADMQKNHGIRHFEYLPDELQRLWSQVPPDAPEMHEYLTPLFAWLEKQLQKGDKLLIQGDYGATFAAVVWAQHKGHIALYGTTIRQTRELPQSDGSIRIERTFRHAGFRAYPALKTQI